MPTSIDLFRTGALEIDPTVQSIENQLYKGLLPIFQLLIIEIHFLANQ